MLGFFRIGGSFCREAHSLALAVPNQATYLIAPENLLGLADAK
jgi:hypothetical protein